MICNDKGYTLYKGDLWVIIEVVPEKRWLHNLRTKLSACISVKELTPFWLQKDDRVYLVGDAGAIKIKNLDYSPHGFITVEYVQGGMINFMSHDMLKDNFVKFCE